MKGKLYLIGKYWSVIGVDEDLKVVTYPIHPDDAASAKEGAEVEFEIKENITYTQGLGCTSTMVAKIIQPANEQQETWTREEIIELLKKLENDGNYFFGRNFMKTWIEENLKKKQQ